MKKTYMTPELTKFDIEIQQQLMAGSDNLKFSPDGQTGEGSLINSEEAEGDAMSRRGGFWDED